MEIGVLLLQGWTLLSVQGVDVVKNGPQSPAGLHIVDFPSQLEKTKGEAEIIYLHMGKAEQICRLRQPSQ